MFFEVHELVIIFQSDPSFLLFGQFFLVGGWPGTVGQTIFVTLTLLDVVVVSPGR
jgi:hypothetical protein